MFGLYLEGTGGGAGQPACTNEPRIVFLPWPGAGLLGQGCFETKQFDFSTFGDTQFVRVVFFNLDRD